MAGPAMKSSPRPKARPAGLKEDYEISQTLKRAENASKREYEDATSIKPLKKAKGGKVISKEGTAKDMAEDKRMAKARGMSMAQWERSAADVKHDAPMKKACGGKVKKMATGGSVRGTGAAIRGKNFSGEF